MDVFGTAAPTCGPPPVKLGFNAKKLNRGLPSTPLRTTMFGLPPGSAPTTMSGTPSPLMSPIAVVTPPVKSGLRASTQVSDRTRL